MIKLILFILFWPAILLFYTVLLAPIAIAISLIPVWLLAYVMFACIAYIGFNLTYKA